MEEERTFVSCRAITWKNKLHRTRLYIHRSNM